MGGGGGGGGGGTLRRSSSAPSLWNIGLAAAGLSDSGSEND
jgi:hypothetical protein